MGQVTIYLDDATVAKLKSASSCSGLSVSRFIANLIEQKTASEWPARVAGLAGTWRDFPDIKKIRKKQPKDVRRESL
jgi:hypothetical protein